MYVGSQQHFDLLNKVYGLFAHANPLHADIFPSVGRMEREVVAMTCAQNPKP